MSERSGLTDYLGWLGFRLAQQHLCEQFLDELHGDFDISPDVVLKFRMTTT